MNASDREHLQRLIDVFEASVAACPKCNHITAETLEGPGDLCNVCWALFECANSFETAHSKFKLNDTQIVIDFQRLTGKLLDEEELDRFKAYMLQFECEEADTVAEAIKKVVASLEISHPELIAEWGIPE